VVFIGFAGPLVRIFTSDPGVVSMAATTLRTVAYGYIFYAWGMVMGQAFNGAGDTKTPTMLNLVCFWLFQIPLAWLLAFHLGLGVNGVFIAIPVAQSTLAVAAVVLFRRGKWKGATI
jgi:Na+-driven multidrug efflux pump